jgi:hypothetical protein
VKSQKSNGWRCFVTLVNSRTSYVHHPHARPIGAVRYPRLVPKDADCAKRLQKRTLTNLAAK